MNAAWIFIDGKVLFLITIIISQFLFRYSPFVWVQAELFAEK